MKIYGVAYLAGCFLAGQLLGEFLGRLLGMDGNIGGVGIAMLLLIISGDRIRSREMLPEEAEKGILFWSAMYIPVVVAMSATQHVKAALTGGWVALLAGLIGTAACLWLVPLVSGLFRKQGPVGTVEKPRI
jgi:malonate transporter MadL subunit